MIFDFALKVNTSLRITFPNKLEEPCLFQQLLTALWRTELDQDGGLLGCVRRRRSQKSTRQREP